MSVPDDNQLLRLPEDSLFKICAHAGFAPRENATRVCKYLTEVVRGFYRTVRVTDCFNLILHGSVVKDPKTSYYVLLTEATDNIRPLRNYCKDTDKRQYLAFTDSEPDSDDEPDDHTDYNTDEYSTEDHTDDSAWEDGSESTQVDESLAYITGDYIAFA